MFFILTLLLATVLIISLSKNRQSPSTEEIRSDIEKTGEEGELQSSVTKETSKDTEKWSGEHLYNISVVIKEVDDKNGILKTESIEDNEFLSKGEQLIIYFSKADDYHDYYIDIFNQATNLRVYFLPEELQEGKDNKRRLFVDSISDILVPEN